ncbi:Fungal-trans domain-containing protein [Mycena indigotica]|uniref:Polynucleotide 5'-hydroxyl-kinase GRC3 n=1 Tax=Mycena indigotica TaxID=2126181 RepID=A0A8H6T4I0_9AGAR|nr:Fungal-trans domain-containing protein [Mycena indigotica]KAF7309762.1 Fungal-trans domain-containing protein [Mycena indigotica]
MLSAFAARKAAQAANNANVAPPPPSPSEPSKPSSKRKLSAQAPNSSRKKKKKEAKKKARYFEEGIDSADIIIVDSGEEDENEDPLDPQELVIAGKRAYSPSAQVNDSSDDEVQILDVPIPPSSYRAPALAPPQHKLSTFSPIADINTFQLLPEELGLLGLQSGVLLSLSPGLQLVLAGVYSLTVLRGTVSIYGASLTASTTSYRVFAPRSAPIPVIEALNSSSLLQISLPERLQPAFSGANDAVLVISALQTGVERLGQVCRVFEGVFSPPRLYSGLRPQHELVKGAKMLVDASKDIQPLFFPPTWVKALDALHELKERTIIVKGAKNVGKSTFSRAVLNRLLSRYKRVAYLDCDLGQSEFTPGGLVTLNVVEQPVLGPPFTHPTIPSFAHYLGATSPRHLPSHYLAAIQSLLEKYRLEVMTLIADDEDDEDDRISDMVPLIVNTMGWVKGLGADLTQRIEELVQPTDVFELDNNTNASPEAENIHCLEPIAPSSLTSNFTAADHRSIAFLSYFHAQFTDPTGVRWNTTVPLCGQRPYEVDCNAAFDQFILCGPGSEDIIPEELTRVLNGAIVGLVECDSRSSDVLYVQGAELPSPATSICHGLAVIRAVSPTGSHLQVLTPVTPNLIPRCRVLVKGELELPVWALLDWTSTEEGDVAGIEKSRVPYLQWDKGEGLGGEKRRIRRNLMRRAQR